MESVGYLIGALMWGVPVATLLMGVCVAGAVVRWRRKAIAALERAEQDEGVQQRGTATPTTAPVRQCPFRASERPV
ncbi:hypothetical protein GCM10017667_23520 [Streptomyces filamentosus]|uniref:Uncharacterized protein n=1 Tax=Streptomyces filamentosus TaxID=67294 RepID=A0A919EJY9_STRFL|nr:hypothetical protein GCM10017667_23520 [Streptomyces filamentosus]